MNRLFLLVLTFALSAPALAQFNIPVYWSGGSGGGGTEICGFNELTIAADPIPAGLTYRWIAEAGWCSGSQSTIVSTGSQVLYFGNSKQIICQAIDSLNQVQGESWPIPVINPDYNGGICDFNNSGSPISACLGDSITLRCNQYLSWSAAISVSSPTDTVLQWQWNGIDIPGTVNDLTFKAGSTGTYRLKFTVSCGVGYSDEIIVNFFPYPTPAIIGNFSICQGSSTTLDAGAGFSSYNWSVGATTQTISVSTAGAYTVTVTNAAGCTGTATTVVTVHPNPIPNITGDSTLCLPQTSILNASGGFPGFTSYFWSNGVFTQANTVSTIGTYTVTVTDNNGCTGSDSIQVTGPYATISGDNSICIGSSTDLFFSFAGTAPFGFSFSDGTSTYGPYSSSGSTTTFSVSPNTNTIYSLVTYFDANCNGNVSGSCTISITNPTPVITGDSTLCQNQTSILDAGSGYSSYLWNTGSTAQTISASTTNTYIVTVTDSTGCTGSDNIVVISQPPYLSTISASGPLGLCLGDSVQLIAQSPMTAYQWYKNNVLISGATTATLWVSIQGKYKCLSVDLSGCAATTAEAKVSIVCFPPLPPGEKEEQLSDTPKLIQLYPNPSQGIFNYKMESETDSRVKIQLTDIMGKIILDNLLIEKEGSLDLSSITSGIYLLKVSDGNSTQTLKLIKTD